MSDVELQQLNLFDGISQKIDNLKHRAHDVLSGINGLEDLDQNGVGISLTDQAALVPVVDENGQTQLVVLGLDDGLQMMNHEHPNV